MKQLFKNFIFAGLFVFLVASPVAIVATPQVAQAAAPGCEDYLLGVIPPWYRGLTDDSGECLIQSPEQVGGVSNFIWTIVLNVIEIGLVITSIIAVFFILYGAFLLITGGGIASQVEKGRKAIFNAVIGLVISIGAIAMTNLVFNVLVGGTLVTNADGILIREITPEELLQNGLNLVYYVAGIVAVITIIIAGLTYTTSIGDAGRITRSKNMILYAVIGLGVLIVAYAITNFVVGRF